MSRRATYLTALVSYAQFGTVLVVGIISVPIALHYLSINQVGLWTFTAQSLGYLLLIDFGISNSISRLLAEPIHRNDEGELSRWYGMIMLILCGQGLLAGLIGLFSVDWVLHWFSLPPDLLAEARKLWLLMLGLNALSFPFRINHGILFAQNRAYWTMLGNALGMWAGLAVFWTLLHRGHGSMAYGWSAVVNSCFSSGLPFMAVRLGPTRFRFSLRNFHWGHLRELFTFSSWSFVGGIAQQIIFMSQEMILTKVLGIRYVAGYNISMKAGTLILQFANRTFDANVPRWQQLSVAGDVPHLQASFQKHFSLALGIILTGGTGLIAANRFFVFHWAKPALYMGRWFDFALAIFITQALMTSSMICLFGIGKNMRRPAIGNMVVAVVYVLLGAFFAKHFGPVGMLTGAVLAASISTLNAWFGTPKVLGLTPGQLFNSLPARVWICLASMLVGGLGFAAFLPAIESTSTLCWEVGLAVYGVVQFLFLFREEILSVLHPLRQRIFGK